MLILILLNQRRIIQLRLVQVQTRTTQALAVQSLLLNLQTVVVITLARLNHRTTVVQVQITQSQPSINMNGLLSTKL